MRRGSLLALIAVASAREKPTSRAARRARKAWLNGTKPPTLNTFYFYVDRDDPKNTTVPLSMHLAQTDINYISCLRLVHHYGRKMAAARAGGVVLVSSSSSMKPEQ